MPRDASAAGSSGSAGTGWARSIILVLASAALHALAFPGWDLTFVAWFALVPFLLALRGATVGRGCVLGLLWGSAAIWGVGHWVPQAFAEYYLQPLWFGVAFALSASVIFAGSYSAGFAATSCWFSGRIHGATRVVLTAVAWVAWELARAQLLTGDPWLLLGYALVPTTSLIQVADLGGVYLLSFIVVLTNAALAEAVHARGRPGAVARALVPAVAVLVLAATYGIVRQATLELPSPDDRVIIVQGNNDLGTQWREEFHGTGLNEYLRTTFEAAERSEPALVVWPESAVTFFLAHEPRFRRGIARVLESVGADLLVGGPHHDGSDRAQPAYYNSAFHVRQNGSISGRYDKRHLLPFAEYFPLRMIEFLRRRFERVRYFTPGDGPVVLDTSLGPVAPVICFEGIFPEIVRVPMTQGAQLLVNLSNDAWLGRGPGAAQHLAMVTLRAVEHRVWLVRATTSGISAFVDPMGRERGRTPMFEAAVLEQRVAPIDIETVYERYGDAFAYACLAVLIAAGFVLVRGPRRETDAG